MTSRDCDDEAVPSEATLLSLEDADMEAAAAKELILESN